MKLYLTSISFEDRCLALPNELALNNRSDRFLLVDFLGYENVSPYLFNRNKIFRILNEKKFSFDHINVNIMQPLEAQKLIKEKISALKPQEIIFDISTYPRNLLFMICRLLAEMEISIKFIYFRPSVYGSELSHGIGNIQSIPGFEGDFKGLGETTLLVVLGFEGYKALYAWEHIGPSKVIAFFGIPPYESDYLEISKKNNKEIFGQCSQMEERDLHTFDVIKAKGQLTEAYQNILEDDPEASIIICPLGTKLQSLATFAFAFENSAVTVAYISSLVYYTENYSRGYSNKSEILLSDLITH